MAATGKTAAKIRGQRRTAEPTGAPVEAAWAAFDEAHGLAPRAARKLAPPQSEADRARRREIQAQLDAGHRADMLTALGTARDTARALSEPELARMMEALSVLVERGDRDVLQGKSEPEPRIRGWVTAVLASRAGVTFLSVGKRLLVVEHASVGLDLDPSLADALDRQMAVTAEMRAHVQTMRLTSNEPTTSAQKLGDAIALMRQLPWMTDPEGCAQQSAAILARSGWPEMTAARRREPSWEAQDRVVAEVSARPRTGAVAYVAAVLRAGLGFSPKRADDDARRVRTPTPRNRTK